ncbi:MAG TPA: DUF1778 domain-containing protein [Armatimonadota bacterium]|nr:DUF1778 domain-containing protein [Armatimonadota bacterium]
MCAFAAKTERLSCRITPEGKKLLEHVAARHGMSVSDYCVTLAIDAASRELLDELVIRIPVDEWDALLAQLDADTDPNDRLKDAARRFARGAFTGDVYHAPD